MPKTLPLPQAVVDRLPNRVSAVIPGTGHCGLEPNSSSLDQCDIDYWISNLAGRSRRYSQTGNPCYYADDRFLYAVKPAIARIIVWDVELSYSSDPSEAYAWDIQDSVDRILREQRLTEESEWEEYEEPLWDPMRAEVRSMVREFYEQADADPE